MTLFITINKSHLMPFNWVGSLRAILLEGEEHKNEDLSSIAFTSQRDKSLSIDRKSDKASRGSKQ